MANTHSLDLEAGSSQYAYIADAGQTGLDLTGDLTFEMWVKIETAPSGGAKYGLITKQAASNESYQFNYRDSSGLKLQLIISPDGGSSEQLFTVAQDLGTATWHHIVVTYDASEGDAEFFVDGSSIGTVNGTASAIYNGNANFIIGSGNAGDRYDGLIDDVRVWSDIRSGAEIAANYQAELIGNEANLVGYWKFNNNYLDETANNNDLTASGSPVFSTDTPFVTGYSLTCDTTSFALTGNNINFIRGYNMLCNVASFTLTGIDVLFKKGYGIICEVGSFILTGFDAIFRMSGWTNRTKPTTSFTDRTKPTTTYSDRTKPTTNWTNR